MPDYRIRIIVDGEGNAVGFLGGVGSALGNIAQIAAGGALAHGITSAIGGIIDAGKQALDTVMGYERMSASLETLLAKEIRNASGIETTIKVGQERLQLTEKEIAQLGKLQSSLSDATLARETLTARIQEQKERIRQLTETYGENGLVVIKERAELAQMENQLSKTGMAIDKYGSQISALEAKNGKLVDVTKKVVEGQLSMTEALAQAGPKAAELLQWTEKLAILSPFTSEDIAKSLQQFMNFNMGSEMAKRLTQDLVDLAAASGKTGDSMGLISYALGQINASDKLLMQDLRQLISAGVDVQGILKKMGYSLSDVGDKAIDSKKFLEIFMTTMEEDFGGAAERSAESLNGLISSLDEIKGLALRDVFTGMFSAAKPVLAELVSMATNPEFRVGLQGIGASLGQGLADSIAFIRSTVLPTLMLLVGWFQTQGVPAAQNFVAVFGPQFAAGLQLIGSVSQQLALVALPLLSQAFQWASQNMQIVGPILGVIAFALGMLIAPILAIPAALVVLATAWANNWGGIQDKTAAVWAFLQPILAGIGIFLLQYVMPPLVQFANFVQTQVIPAVSQFAMWLGPQLGAGLQQLYTWAQQIATAALPLLTKGFEQLSNFALPLLAQAFQWAGQNMEIVGPILGVIAAALGLVLAPVVAIPAALIVLATAWANNWGGIQEKTAVVWSALQPILSGFVTFLGTLVSKGVELGTWFQANLPVAIAAFQNAIMSAQPVFDLAGRGMSAIISIATSLSRIWLNLNMIVNGFTRYLGDIIAKFLGIDQSVSASQKRLQGLGDFLGVIGGILNAFIENVLKRLTTEFGILVGLLETLAHWLGIVADALSNLQIPEAFQRHSPSPFEQALMGANEHLRTLLSLIPRVNFANLRLGDFDLRDLSPEKFEQVLARLHAGLSKLGSDPLKNWDDVKRQVSNAIDLFNNMKRAGVEMPAEFKAGLEAAIDDMLNLGKLAPDVVKELKDKLGAPAAGGGGLAAAGAGALGGGAVTNDNRITFNNYGNIYLAANNAREFFDSFDEFSERVDIERRFAG